MRARVFAVMALALLPLAVADLAGQDQRFRGLDRNGDGRITRDEWRGSARAFRNHDWNGDGVLMGREIEPGGRRDIDDVTDQTQRPAFDDWTVEGFNYLDRNRDGRISRAEWLDDRMSFIRADRNRDNVLTRAEMLATETPREERFETLDANNNGRIERHEWTGREDRFDMLDRNNDNVISRAEMLGPADDVESRAFGDADLNRDNRLSQNEWQWARRVFTQQDTNRSGYVEREEFWNPASEAVGTREAELFANADFNRDNRLSQREWRWSQNVFTQQDIDRSGYVERDEFRNPGTESVTGTAGYADNRTVNSPVVIHVSARERWVDTGLDTRAGDLLRITSTGSVRLSAGTTDMATPGGANRRAEQAPMPFHPAGALIGRIANGAPFFIGDGTNVDRVSAAGRLYLSVNDDHLEDNSGTFRVTIVIRPQDN